MKMFIKLVVKKTRTKTKIRGELLEREIKRDK
jgi:hypothetical protein